MKNSERDRFLSRLFFFSLCSMYQGRAPGFNLSRVDEATLKAWNYWDTKVGGGNVPLHRLLSKKNVFPSFEALSIVSSTLMTATTTTMALRQLFEAAKERARSDKQSQGSSLPSSRRRLSVNRTPNPVAPPPLSSCAVNIHEKWCEPIARLRVRFNDNHMTKMECPTTPSNTHTTTQALSF